MIELGPKDLGGDIDPTTGNFVKKTPEATEQPRNIEIESTVDFGQIERSLNDGTADEYRENVGAIPVEGLLEEQGDERVRPQLSEAEKTATRESFSGYASKSGLKLVEDDISCMAMVA